jgi:hypothetical protein
MAGTIVANTLNTDTAGTVFTTNNAFDGIAKAWVNFDGSVASPTIRASLNVSSITKPNSGFYVINFSVAFVDTNYVISGTANSSTAGMPANSFTWLVAGAGSYAGTFVRTTSSCAVQSIYNTSSQADADYINVIFHR